MMDVIRFHCPVCGSPIKVAAHFAGHSGKCPACSGKFTVPYVVQPEQPLDSDVEASNVVEDGGALDAIASAVNEPTVVRLRPLYSPKQNPVLKPIWIAAGILSCVCAFCLVSAAISRLFNHDSDSSRRWRTTDAESTYHPSIPSHETPHDEKQGPIAPGSGYRYLEKTANQRLNEICPGGCTTLGQYRELDSEFRKPCTTTEKGGHTAYQWRYGDSPYLIIVLIEEDGKITQANVVLDMNPVTERNFTDRLAGLSEVGSLVANKLGRVLSKQESDEMADWIDANSNNEGAKKFFAGFNLLIDTVVHDENGHHILIWIS